MSILLNQENQWQKKCSLKKKLTEFYVSQVLMSYATDIKGCVRYIFASLFLSLKESAFEIWKYVFYSTSKALFVHEKIKFWCF